MVASTNNWDELFLNKNCQSPKDQENLKFRNNYHPITGLFRGQLYEINEQNRDVHKK